MVDNQIVNFDIKNVANDVLLKLNYVDKKRMHFDEELNALKKDLLAFDSDNFIGIYAHRLKDSYEVIGHFNSMPTFPSNASTNIQSTVLTETDLKALSQQQLYTVNENGLPILAYVSSQYGMEYYFNLRKKQHENLPVLNIFNPNEHVVNLDFDFSNAIFSVDDDSISGETFYVLDEWSKDVRVTINQDAEAVFNTADDFVDVKNFHDYTVNDMVLIKHGGIVRRGCIYSRANNVCEVLCVDYGIKLRCSTNQLRVAPPCIAYTPFLAIPCTLNGIARPAPKKVRKYVSELVHQLDRSRTELIAYGKDEKSIQRIDILFEDKSSGEKISVAKYLEKSGLIKMSKARNEDCKYDFSEIMKMIVDARQISLSDAEPIQRSFMKPSDFISTNSTARKLGVSI